MVSRLDPSSFDRGVRSLTRRDQRLRDLVRRHGPPPFWRRSSGFPTLLYIILEQQVSLASARAVFEKTKALVPRLDARSFSSLDDLTLRRVGFSRQKTRYARALADAVRSRLLVFSELAHASDDVVRVRLKDLPGIGDWTADIYLLSALRRPDVWPVGDLALLVAARETGMISASGKTDALQTLGEAWRPWRSVAARILWHHYLSTRRKRMKRI